MCVISFTVMMCTCMCITSFTVLLCMCMYVNISLLLHSLTCSLSSIMLLNTDRIFFIIFSPICLIILLLLFSLMLLTGADGIVISSEPGIKESPGSLSASARKYFVPKILEGSSPEEIWSWWQSRTQQEKILKSAIISAKVH